MRIAVLIGLLALPMLPGCGGKVITRKFDPGKPSQGVTYNLPRTLVKVEMSYEVTVMDTLKPGGYDRVVTAKNKSVTITTQIVPDPRAFFEIVHDKDDGFLLKNEVKFDLTEKSGLSKANAVFEDATLETVKEVADILKVVFKPRAFGVTKAESLNGRVEELKVAREKIQSEIESALKRPPVPGSDSKPSQDFLAALEKRKLDLDTEIAKLQKPFSETADVRFSCLGDPPDTLDAEGTRAIAFSGSDCPELAYVLKELGSTIPTGMDGKFRFTVDLGGPGPQLPSGENDGIVFRVPTEHPFQLTGDQGGLLATGWIRINQYNPIGVLPVRGKAFAKRELQLELYPESGGLKTYSMKSEKSSAKEFSTAAKELLAKIEEATKKPETKEVSEIESLEADTKLLEAKLKNLEMRRKLETAAQGGK